VVKPKKPKKKNDAKIRAETEAHAKQLADMFVKTLNQNVIDRHGKEPPR
jgi:hypothetical protein